MGGEEPPSGIRARPGRPRVREVTGTVRSGAVKNDGPSVPAGSGGGSRGGRQPRVVLQLAYRRDHDIRRRQFGRRADPAQNADDETGAGRASHGEVGRGVADDGDAWRLGLQRLAQGEDRIGLGFHREPVVPADHALRPPPARPGLEASRRSGRDRRWSRPRSAGPRRATPRRGRGGPPGAWPARPDPGTNHADSVARRAAATLGHQRRRTVATTPSIWAIVAAASGPPAATRPVEGSKPMAANTSGATGRRAAASRRVPSSRAQPPHIAWKSMSVPSLSKITRSIPARSTGEPPVTTASPPRPPGRRSGPGRRRARGPGRPPVGTRARSAIRLRERRGSGC